MTDRLGLSLATRDKMASAIADIARVVERPPPPHDGDKLLRASLLGGNAGYAVALAYLDKWTPNARWKRIGAKHLERAIDQVPNCGLRPFFAYGFSGTGWAVQHLSRWFIGVPGDALDDIDDALLEIVQRAVTVSYDLQHGLPGFGLYALERLPLPAGARLVSAIVERLARDAEKRPRGALAWRVVNAAWAEGPGAFSRETIYDAGVFNGVAGIAGMLGGAIAAGIATDEARRLLDGALRWTWANLPADPARRATWMHGALGIATVTFAAARAAGIDTWQTRALVLARELARESTRLRESGIAEGVAGAVQMFYRLYLATGEPVFADATRGYLGRLLRRRRAPDVGLAGFVRFSHHWQRGYLSDPDFPIGWVGSPALAMGVTGIGLVLASILHDQEPVWDRVLLLSHADDACKNCKAAPRA